MLSPILGSSQASFCWKHSVTGVKTMRRTCLRMAWLSLQQSNYTIRLVGVPCKHIFSAALPLSRTYVTSEDPLGNTLLVLPDRFIDASSSYDGDKFFTNTVDT